MAGVTADRCPGVLRPHLAADGAMVRVRVPGGQTTGAALGRLGELAATYGSGLLQLTSRGSLQLRGLPDPVPEEFVAGITAAGFLPSAPHERVRNIVASPLTGLHGGRADLRPMVGALDEALRAAADLAGLSGRFLFALDDGRGDVTTLPFDVAYQAHRARPWRDHGRRPATAGAGDRGRAGPDRRRAHGRLGPGHSTGSGCISGLRSSAQSVTHASVVVPLGFLTPEQLAAVGPHRATDRSW